jgi:hypothetical protein
MKCPKCLKEVEKYIPAFLSDRYFCCECGLMITIDEIGNLNDPINFEDLCE